MSNLTNGRCRAAKSNLIDFHPGNPFQRLLRKRRHQADRLAFRTLTFRIVLSEIAGSRLDRTKLSDQPFAGAKSPYRT